MPLPGQASGGWTESSSALRILNVGIRNSLAPLTDDAFTQANPVAVATGVSSRLDITLNGVLSGSVCFTRPLDGNQFVGGPGTDDIQTLYRANTIQQCYRPLGLFINTATGNPYENLPGVASGVGPYVSGMGTYGSSLYETALIAGGGDPLIDTGDSILTSYITGNELIASRNGFLMPKWILNAAGTDLVTHDLQAVTAQSFVMSADSSSTTIGIIKMAPDTVQTEVVWDQRI